MSKKPVRRPAEASAKTARQRQSVLGGKLRQLYDDVANEPVPEDFLKLLAQADEKKSDKNGHGGDA